MSKVKPKAQVQRLKAHDSKGKAPMGVEGSRPKFDFKPIFRLLVLVSHLKKGSGLGSKKATGLGQPDDSGESTSLVARLPLRNSG